MQPCLLPGLLCCCARGKRTLWEQQPAVASLCSQGHGQAWVCCCHQGSGVEGTSGVQACWPTLLVHPSHGHAVAGPRPLLALVLLQAGVIAALALTAGAHDALAGREPSPPLDVSIHFRVCALHARLAIHGGTGVIGTRFLTGLPGLPSLFRAGEPSLHHHHALERLRTGTHTVERYRMGSG